MVVVNRHSRRADKALGALHDALRARGLHVAAFHPVPNNRVATKIVRRAAKAGAEAVLVGGGDGTLTHAVNALAHSRTVLGVLPLGTGNSFAQSLGFPAGDLDAALDAVAHGRVTEIDLGVVNGTYFANFATIGLSSAIADATQHRWKAIFGKIAYGVAAVVPLLRHRGFRAKIRYDEGKLTVHTQDIVIANGRYFGESPVTPDASLVSGHLALCTVDDPSHLGALITYAAYGLADQTKLAGAHVINAKKIAIRTNIRQQISVDGSILEKTPARFHVAPRALRVYVPAGGVARG